jgi:hypothetical protein
MMNTQGWSLIVAGVGIVGTVSGALANSLITRSTQRNQWVRDKKMQEYRELLSALSRAEMLLIQSRGVRGGEDGRPLDEATLEARIAIKDRIFIANVMKEVDVEARWRSILIHYYKERNTQEFTGAYSTLVANIMRAAFKDLGIKGKYEENDAKRLEAVAKG